jgi:hypothetical protein
MVSSRPAFNAKKLTKSTSDFVPVEIQYYFFQRDLKMTDQILVFTAPDIAFPWFVALNRKHKKS